MKRKEAVIRFSALSVCLVLFLSFSSHAGPVRVGVLVHLTGDLSEFGQMQRKSMMIALENIRKREADSISIVPVFRDTPADPGKVRAVVNDLVSTKGVSIITAGMTSTTAWVAASQAQSLGIPFLICTASADKITEQGWKYVFRLNPPFSEYGNAMLWFLSEIARPKTVAILREEGFSGLLSSDNLSERCQKSGYEIVLNYLYKKDTKDFEPVLNKIKKKNPDVIAMGAFLNSAVRLIRQCRELRVTPRIFMGLGGGFTLPQFGELCGNAADFVCSITIWHPSVPYPGGRQYYDTYLERYHCHPDYHGAEAYAAMQVVADVLKRTPSLDPEDIRASLLATDMTTIIGRVKFVSYGNKMQQNRLPTYLLQWEGGRMSLVWPPDLASRKYVYPFPGWKRRPAEQE